MKKEKKKKIPDLTEFIDEEGKKWIQTSTDDLFSIKEISELLDTVEKDKEEGEIVLARIDFQKVNREYYEKAHDLHTKLKRRDELIKKLITESKKAIDRKNAKLKELIEYIKNLHLLLTYYKLDPSIMKEIQVLPVEVFKPEVTAVEEEEIEVKKIGYSEVEEVLLDDKGEESGKAS
jgi:DNA-binding transcriptional MerR regulator